MRLRTILLYLLFLSPVEYSYATSFYCGQPASNVEKMICSEKDLGILDDRLADTYQRRITESDNETPLRIAQRRWLRDVRNHCASEQCLKEAYETRLYELKWDVDYVDRAPKKALVRTLCEKLVSRSEKEKILSSRDGIEDINNDGRAEVSKECWGGTMNTPCTDYFDRSGKQIEFEQIGFEWKDYWTYGRQAFRYDGRTFILNSSDDSLQEPTYLSYITPTNKEHVLCEFSNHVTAVIEHQSAENNGVCQGAIGEYGLEGVELPENVESQPGFLNRPNTRATKTGLLDVNNDGEPEVVMELAYESGGGRGCDYNYYELIDRPGKDFMSGSKKRFAFLAMQGANESGFEGRSCGHIENQLFSYKGKIYYEHNVDNNETADHTISIQRGDSVNVVCKYRRVVKTELKGLVIDAPQFEGH